MKGICPNCEKETRLELISRYEEIVVRGEPISVHVEYYKCSECGTEFRDPRSPEDPLDTAYREYRKRRGMIQPENIREFRKQFGLTQHEMSNLLGWGAVTLSRYENGALQDDAHDTTFKLAMEPENLLELIEQSPEALSPDKKGRLVKALRGIMDERESSFRAIYETRFGRYEADIYSGYRQLDIAKLFNAIIFFCKDDDIPKTKLNKLLFFADFKHFKEYTVSITGAHYAHLPYGPAPDNYHHYIATLHHEEDVIQIEERSFDGNSREYFGEYLSALRDPDLSLFSTTELKVLALIKEHFTGMTASAISDLSHKEEGYQQTNDGDLISYSYSSTLSI